MENLYSKWTLRFHDPFLETKFQEKHNIQRLYFFRSLLTIGILTCFIAMIIFIVQSAQYHIIIFMVSLTIIHIIFLFFSLKLQPYLKCIFTLLYISYVAAGTLITYAQNNVPFYNYGYCCCHLYTTVLQYCDNRFKLVFLFSTSCIILGVFVKFQLDQMAYVVFCISMMILQGIITYLFEYTARLEFYLQYKIKSQQSIIYKFVQDPLFAISFNKKVNSFQLEFANKTFESLYNQTQNGNQFKEFLRTYSIITKNLENSNSYCCNRSIQKQINLEDYLFDLIKNDKFKEEEYIISIQAQKEKDKITIDIMRFQYQEDFIILIIHPNQLKLQIEKYEHKIKYINENFISVLQLIGNKLEEQYKNLQKLNKNLHFHGDILKSYFNIQFTLNCIKNHLIYLNKGKMQFLKQQIELFKIEKLNESLSNYFIHYCQIHRKQFQLNCSYEVEQQYINLNTRLLTQLLINFFNKIMKISEPGSSIQLQIELQGIPNQTLIENNINEYYGFQLIKFSYTFEHKDQIENIETQFYQSLNQESKENLNIEKIVNLIILKILSPYNFIQNTSIQQESLSNYKTTLIFYIYTDQTQLDPSYIKYNQEKILEN